MDFLNFRRVNSIAWKRSDRILIMVKGAENHIALALTERETDREIGEYQRKIVSRVVVGLHINLLVSIDTMAMRI